MALEREPRNVYPLLYLGVIEAARDRQAGLRLVSRASELSPHDPVIRRAERRLRRGRSVNLNSLSREIVETADELGTAVDRRPAEYFPSLRVFSREPNCCWR